MNKDDQVVVAFELVRARHDWRQNRSGKEHRWTLIPFRDLKPSTSSNFLVEGVIPSTGLVAVWGPPKCGKSFWTFDLAMHIALGWPYRGRRVNGGPVCYLAFEGAAGFGARAEAFRRTHTIEGDVPFYLLGSNAKLVRDHAALIEAISDQIESPPMAVVLDTLNRSIDGSESKDEDMGRYLAAAEVIVQEFDCAVIIVHHCGTDSSRPRGHTSLTGAADAQIAVKRDAAGNVVATVEYAKDTAQGASFVSALRPVEVGIDNEGQPITSCTIVPVENAPASTGGTTRKTLSGNQARFLDIFKEAFIDTPEVHKAGAPGGGPAISREWLKMCLQSNGWFDPKAKDASNRARLSNAINALAARRLIGASGTYVWDARS